MKIGILCFRSYDAYEGKSEIRMKEVGEALGHEVLLIQVPLCTFSPEGEIFYEGMFKFWKIAFLKFRGNMLK